MTAQVAVAHGIAPGQTYTLQGFTGTGFTGYNATYTALTWNHRHRHSSARPRPAAGHARPRRSTFPAMREPLLVELVARSPSFRFPPRILLYTVATGITSKNGQHFCGIVGEYGADSAFPGAQFASFVDDRGNALPGAPALVPWLNQGTANFTGYVTVGTQSPSSPALTVTAMNSYAIAAASFNASTGFVTFTTATSPGFIPGSEFTVSSVSPSGYNQTYVAVAGTTGTTLVGNPLSGPVGVPQALSESRLICRLAAALSPSSCRTCRCSASPAAMSSRPMGRLAARASGGVGTYGLVGTPTTTAITAKIDNGAGAAGTTLTTTSGGSALVVGSAISGAGVTSGTIITAVLSTTTFTVNNSQLVATSEAMTNAGTVGSSGAPVTIFAFPLHYYSADAGTTAANPYGGVTTARTQSVLGDMWHDDRVDNDARSGPGQSGWGGSLANVSMLWGAFPQSAGGAPSTTALASLCKKSTDIQTFRGGQQPHRPFALSPERSWDLGRFQQRDDHRLYRQRHRDGAGTATLHVLTTPYGSLAPPANLTATIAGPGPCRRSLGPPTIPLLSSGATATYTVTFAAGITSANLGSAGSPVTFTVGAFKPATPLAVASFNGYIDNGGASTPTLHVTSLADHRQRLFHRRARQHLHRPYRQWNDRHARQYSDRHGDAARSAIRSLASGP